MNDELPFHPVFPLDIELRDDSKLRDVAIQAYQRLKTDNRMEKVVQEFQHKGIEERNIEWLLSTLPSIYGEWEVIKSESLKERQNRHSKLASKISDIVKELDADDDTKYFTICDARILRETYELIPEIHDLVRRGLLVPEAIILSSEIRTQRPPVPSISQYLSGFAEMLVQGYLIPSEDEDLLNKLPYKRNIRIYTIKRIQELITNMFEQAKQKLPRQYNKDIAILANTLLNLKEKPVTANDVTQVLKETRRKYWID